MATTEATATPATAILQQEIVPISSLRPHPKNYRSHHSEQNVHLDASLREHGVYRNVVVARDGTILAGHGVVESAARIGLESISVVRLDVDPNSPAALRVLVGDNEISKLSVVDDRALTDMLAAMLKDNGPEALVGTGLDDMMLRGLIMVTRTTDELRSKASDGDEAWGGLADFDNLHAPLKIVVSFNDEAAIADFHQRLDLPAPDADGVRRRKKLGSMWWPPRPDEEVLRAVNFDSSAQTEDAQDADADPDAEDSDA